MKVWLTGYFAHSGSNGLSTDDESRTPLRYSVFPGTELADISEEAPLSDMYTIMPQGQEIMEKMTNDALFTPPKDWPNVSITHICATQTIWICVAALHESKRRLAEAKAAGKTLRPVEFIEIEGQNHMVGGLNDSAFNFI